MLRLTDLPLKIPFERGGKGWGDTINKGKNPGGWEEGFITLGTKNRDVRRPSLSKHTCAHIHRHTRAYKIPA